MKWMVSSTAIPSTIAPTMMVPTSRGIPQRPIAPSVATIGRMFGIIPTKAHQTELASVDPVLHRNRQKISVIAIVELAKESICVSCISRTRSR